MLKEMEEEGGKSVYKSPLNNANDPVKCNYIIYWSAEVGMELIDKWEIEGKIHDGNRNQIGSILNFLKKTLHPNQMP